MTISLQALRDRRDQLAASLARVDDLRPGFLTARFRKCGKPNCHCAQKDSPGHVVYLIIGLGKTVTQVIPRSRGRTCQSADRRIPPFPQPGTGTDRGK